MFLQSAMFGYLAVLLGSTFSRLLNFNLSDILDDLIRLPIQVIRPDEPDPVWHPIDGVPALVEDAGESRFHVVVDLDGVEDGRLGLVVDPVRLIMPDARYTEAGFRDVPHGTTIDGGLMVRTIASDGCQKK